MEARSGACGSVQICTRMPPESCTQVGQRPAYFLPAVEPATGYVKLEKGDVQRQLMFKDVSKARLRRVTRLAPQGKNPPNAVGLT